MVAPQEGSPSKEILDYRLGIPKRVKEQVRGVRMKILAGVRAGAHGRNPCPRRSCAPDVVLGVPDDGSVAERKRRVGLCGGATDRHRGELISVGVVAAEGAH